MFKEAMFSSVKNFFIIWLYASVLLIGGCTAGSEQAARENMREYTHPNGLTIKLNEDFSAKQIEKGFIIEPANGSNENVRRPVEIKISLHKDAEIPRSDSMMRKEVGNREINYQITKDDGGSGGEMYAFNGFEKVPGGYIEYSQTTQSEISEPDFQTIWKMIENTSWKR